MSESQHTLVPTLPMLVERWGQVVEEIERGYTLTFDDYLNDVDLRHLIARSLRNVPHFYDQLCPACADLQLRKRTETADLRGRVALLTGGRVKIGYQAGIKLLRAGAT
jgi:hypothetical protein